MNTLLLSAYRLSRKIYSVRQYVWHRFWKGEKSWWDSKQSECLCRRSRPKSFLKKDVMRNFARKHKENICAKVFFWCFVVNFAKSVRKLFLQNSTRRLLSINSNEGNIGKQNCKLWYKDWSIYISLSQKCKLLKRVAQVKVKVLETVVRRIQIKSS